MNSLLIFVFAFFGVHTTLWLTRSVRAKRAERTAQKPPVRAEHPPVDQGPMGAGEAEKKDE
jgi:hypothetical protein